MLKGRQEEMGEREDKKRRIEGKPKSKDGERGKLKDKGTIYENGNDMRMVMRNSARKDWQGKQRNARDENAELEGLLGCERDWTPNIYHKS